MIWIDSAIKFAKEFLVRAWKTPDDKSKQLDNQERERTLEAQKKGRAHIMSRLREEKKDEQRERNRKLRQR